MKGLSRLWLGGLKTSDSVVGGVGSVLEGGPPTPPLDAFAPGQYPAPAWEFEKSREGNFSRNAEDGGGAANRREIVGRAEVMLGERTSSRAEEHDQVAVLIAVRFGGVMVVFFLVWQ